MTKKDGFYLPNPGISFWWLIEIIIKALSALLPIITPELRALLEKFLLDFYKKAQETPNPWDNFLAGFLLRILQIPVPD